MTKIPKSVDDSFSLKFYLKSSPAKSRDQFSRNQSAMEKSVDLVPALVVFLAAAHVVALVYWIYRLASDRQPKRSKSQ